MATLQIDVDTDAADAVAGLGDVGGALDKVGGKAAAASDDMTRSSRSMEDVAGAADNLASASSQTAGGLGDLGGALGLLPGPLGLLGRGMEAAAPAIMGVTGAADLLNVATEKFPKVGAAAAKVTNVLAAAKRALGVAIRFAMGPVGLVIAGLALLAGALVLAYKNSETFRTVVDGAFKAIAGAGRFLWNNVLQPIFRLMLKGFAAIADGYAKLLRGLSKVPGFGWARTAADAMGAAADKARGMADNMGKIPKNTVARVSAPGLTEAARAAERLARAFSNAAAEYIELIGLGALTPGRTAGGTASRTVAGGTTTVARPTVEITVNGAIDPIGTARQIETMLRQYGVLMTGTR